MHSNNEALISFFQRQRDVVFIDREEESVHDQSNAFDRDPACHEKAETDAWHLPYGTDARGPSLAHMSIQVSSFADLHHGPLFLQSPQPAICSWRSVHGLTAFP